MRRNSLRQRILFTKAAAEGGDPLDWSYAQGVRMTKPYHEMTPAERLAQIESDPKAMAIIKQNGLTARDYVVGVPTLRMALLAAQGAPTGSYVIASPANVAFAKTHLAELKPKMDAADAIRPQK